MLRYSLPSQTRVLHRVAAGLALVAALIALVTGLVMAGTIDIPSPGDDAEADRPAVVVPSMHQSDPPLPADQPVVPNIIVPSMHQSDPPLPAEQADDVSVEQAPWWPDHLEP